jgi:zinc protease
LSPPAKVDLNAGPALLPKIIMTKAVQKTAPESLSPIAFNIPDAFETKLDNGLRIVAFQDNRLPLVSYRLAFITGDINDPADNIGLHSAVAALLTEGTRNYSSKELAERIERLGASVSANSSDDFTLVAASSLSLYNSEMLDLLAEVVLLPTFPENELDLYRRNTVEHLKFQRSQAGFLAGEQSARLLYGEHPYSRVTATAEDIEKITRQQLAEVHKLSYIPNNAIMIVVGDVDKDTLVKDIGDRFNRWAAGETPADEPSTLRGRTNRTLTIVDRPGSAQSNIVIGNLAIDRRSPD